MLTYLESDDLEIVDPEEFSNIPKPNPTSLHIHEAL